jgi:hypothetical protein
MNFILGFITGFLFVLAVRFIRSHRLVFKFEKKINKGGLL